MPRLALGLVGANNIRVDHGESEASLKLDGRIGGRDQNTRDRRNLYNERIAVRVQYPGTRMRTYESWKVLDQV